MKQPGNKTRRPTEPTSSEDVALHTTLSYSQGEAPIDEPTTTERPADGARYRIGPELARGGLGRILQGHDTRLDRPVAVKALLSSNRALRKRFQREAAITARLQHPAIVPVYDTGSWKSGESYYVMKLLSGGNTLKQLLAQAATLDERLALVPNCIAVADAMAYAHSLGVIHRDLKPSNVIVGPFGETVVIDWGLAKDCTQPASDDGPEPSLGDATGPAMTSLGTILGTPQYMSPEQARGEAVDARTDVYALGALLYHVLAGVVPFDGDSPASVVQRVIDERPIPVEERAPGVPPDLAAIVRKAMARAASDRYPSAQGLADDLRRFQTGQLVNAHHYTRGLLFRRWLRRYRALVVVTAVALATVVVAVGISMRKIVDGRNVAERRRQEAVEARNQAVARENELILTHARSSLLLDPTAALRWLARYPATMLSSNVVRTLAAEAQGRGVARHTLRGARIPIGHIAYSADGRMIASASSEHVIRIWDPARGTELRHIDGIGEISAFAWARAGDGLVFAGSNGQLGISSPTQTRMIALGDDERVIFDLNVSPSGQEVAVAGNRLLVWDLQTARGYELRGHLGAARHAAFSPSGRWLASCGADRAVMVWELATRRGQRVGHCHPGEFASFAFAPHRDRLATIGEGNRIELIDLGAHAGQRSQIALPDVPIGLFAFSADGTRLVTATGGGHVQVYDVAKRTFTESHALDGDVYDLAFSPTDSMVAAASRAGTLYLFDLDKHATTTRRGHEGAIPRALFSPDGGEVVTTGWDGTIRIWDTPRDLPLVLSAGDRLAFHVQYATSRNMVITDGIGGAPRVWDLATRRRRLLVGHRDMVYGLALAADRFLASASWDGTVRFWDLVSGAQRVLPEPPVIVNDLAIDATGTIIAAGGADGGVRLWNRATDRVETLGRHARSVNAVAMLADASRVLSASADGTLHLWTLATHQERVLTHHSGSVEHASLSPDGRHALSGGRDGDVCLWDLASGACAVIHHFQDGYVTQAAFSADGRWAATASSSGELYVRDMTGERELDLRLHTASINSLALSPASPVLATASEDSSVRVVDLESGRVLAFYGHFDGVDGVAFAADGASVASAGRDGVVCIWPVRLERAAPVDASAMAHWLHAQTGAP